jgi:DNA-binding response OmpR family regulator
VRWGEAVLASFKILVVDDFEGFRRFVSSVLQPRPECQVSEASNGLEAVQKAVELQPDLILLDIGLPNLNGLEVAKRVSNLAPAAKILFISVESDPDVVIEALGLGAGYVHKPRLQADLPPAIEAVLRGEQFVSPDLRFDGRADVPKRHEILFCPDDAAIVDGFARFIGAALNAGNPALVLLTESHRNDLLDGLRAQDVNVDAAIQRGTYISLDATVAPDPVRFLEAIRLLIEAATNAGKKRPRVAFCGERAGRLWVEGKTDEAIQLEQFCDSLVKTYELDILCVYPMPQGQEEHPAFKSICAEHSATYSR